MFTTIIHPIRKALLLSCNEYVVLDHIYRLSNNTKYGGWCIASKEKIAEWNELSRPTVFRIIDTLLEKNLIEKDLTTGYLRTLDQWNELIANQHDWTVNWIIQTYDNMEYYINEQQRINLSILMETKKFINLEGEIIAVSLIKRIKPVFKSMLGGLLKFKK